MQIPFLFLTLPVAATLLGGFLALRLGGVRPVLVALGAGLLLGAAFLDILPEAISVGIGIGLTVERVLGLTLLFFLLFSALEIALGFPSEHAQASSLHASTSRRHRGRLAGGMLIFHSFRDGIAIGAAFAASHTAGYAVSIGIAAHDFGDGMSTVLLTTGGEPPRLSDYLFLAADALAPFFGGLLTVWWVVSSRNAVLLLALAAGFFLQMATSDFLPQLRGDPTRRSWLMLPVVGGAGIIYAANLLLGAR